MLLVGPNVAIFAVRRIAEVVAPGFDRECIDPVERERVLAALSENCACEPVAGRQNEQAVREAAQALPAEKRELFGAAPAVRLFGKVRKKRCFRGVGKDFRHRERIESCRGGRVVHDVHLIRRADQMRERSLARVCRQIVREDAYFARRRQIVCPAAARLARDSVRVEPAALGEIANKAAEVGREGAAASMIASRASSRRRSEEKRAPGAAKECSTLHRAAPNAAWRSVTVSRIAGSASEMASNMAS